VSSRTVNEPLQDVTGDGMPRITVAYPECIGQPIPTETGESGLSYVVGTRRSQFIALDTARCVDGINGRDGK